MHCHLKKFNITDFDQVLSLPIPQSLYKPVDTNNLACPSRCLWRWKWSSVTWFFLLAIWLLGDTIQQLRDSVSLSTVILMRLWELNWTLSHYSGDRMPWLFRRLLESIFLSSFRIKIQRYTRLFARLPTNNWVFPPNSMLTIWMTESHPTGMNIRPYINN